MDNGRDERSGRTWFWVAVAIFIAAIAYVLVVAGTVANLTNAADDPPLLVLGAAGVIALLGWWRDRARRAALAEDVQSEREPWRANSVTVKSNFVSPAKSLTRPRMMSENTGNSVSN